VRSGRHSLRNNGPDCKWFAKSQESNEHAAKLLVDQQPRHQRHMGNATERIAAGTCVANRAVVFRVGPEAVWSRCRSFDQYQPLRLSARSRQRPWGALGRRNFTASSSPRIVDQSGQRFAPGSAATVMKLTRSAPWSVSPPPPQGPAPARPARHLRSLRHAAPHQPGRYSEGFQSDPPPVVALARFPDAARPADPAPFLVMLSERLRVAA
jgi:hypothetical protein